jgi:hypothetical protein
MLILREDIHSGKKRGQSRITQLIIWVTKTAHRASFFIERFNMAEN